MRQPHRGRLLRFYGEVGTVTRAPAETYVAYSWKHRVANAVYKMAASARIRVEPLEDTASFVDDGQSRQTPEMMDAFAQIPGMTSFRRGMYLYWLAYACSAPGDIIEVGVWQGRATAFLAQACADADAGVVHAIDPFTGNPGTAHLYEVSDVADLQVGFEANIQRSGLVDRVVTWPGKSSEVADAVRSKADGVRMICIDGDHSYEAVRNDINLFADALEPGGILLFDDYEPSKPGLVQAVLEHLEANPDRYTKPVQDRSMLVLRRR